MTGFPKVVSAIYRKGYHLSFFHIQKSKLGTEALPVNRGKLGFAIARIAGTQFQEI